MRDRLYHFASCQSCRPAMQPTHVLADSHRRKPIHMPEVDHSDACTIRAAGARAALSQIRSPRGPAAHSEMPGPMRHTTDTPTCRALKSHQRYTGAATGCCAQFFVLPPAEDCSDRLRASSL